MCLFVQVKDGGVFAKSLQPRGDHVFTIAGDRYHLMNLLVATKDTSNSTHTNTSLMDTNLEVLSESTAGSSTHHGSLLQESQEVLDRNTARPQPSCDLTKRKKLKHKHCEQNSGNCDESCSADAPNHNSPERHNVAGWCKCVTDSETCFQCSEMYYVIFVTGQHDTVVVHEVSQCVVENAKPADEQETDIVDILNSVKDPDYKFVYKDCYITGAALSPDKRYELFTKLTIW